MNAQVVTIPHMFPGKQFYNDVREFDSLQDQTHPSKTQAGTKLPQEPPRKLQIARHAVHGHCQNGMLPWMTSFAIINRGASSHFSGCNTPSATVDRTDRPYHSWKVEKHHTACNEKNAVHEESRCVMHGQFLSHHCQQRFCNQKKTTTWHSSLSRAFPQPSRPKARQPHSSIHAPLHAVECPRCNPLPSYSLLHPAAACK